MKISTKGKYGLEAVLDIAIHSSEGPVNIKNISERQGISDKYLEQIFIKLKKNNIVESIRGAQGGYILSRNPKEITVKEILNVLEGPLCPVECIEEKENCCNQFENCTTKIVWKRVKEELDAVTEAITLTDLMDCYQKQDSASEIEYYI